MNIHRLEIFVDLSKTFNYTDTAENFYTTQSNISKQILSLEKELSVSLFKREHRKIELTNEGRIILPHAQKIIDDFTNLQHDLNDYQDAKNLTIEMYTIPTMPNYQSFNLITQFLKQHPEIHVQLKEEESNNLFTALKSDKCEMIFARTFSFDDDKLEYIPMEFDSFVAVLPKHHKYAKLNKLDIEDLAHDNFLILGKSTNLYTPVTDLCHNAGFNPKVMYEGSRVDLIMQMVENNMGISILMEKTVKSFKNNNFVTVPITSNVENELGFFRKKGKHSEASEVFWKFIKNNIK
ncbi:LysR family transcriptional regulator (plasmid) [Companilactobacillus allii]|uniref:LysR family transcriptional regulator n=1 Tax=Companilactobacillus allii TaxID=1847728 RepID=A0A1P8Q5W3_9LACO|nr:LysR family transcriptional regulator [Companilactobacillus allii]APX73264.1 LysR family transcriptional regulator [Companilactobacillus allii]USQ68080.1 LysR family transcriptional regulator [Companilactobacillus allii]USQ69928.1 LysR family transcriptional regulator [Companilactobacillus allii]